MLVIFSNAKLSINSNLTNIEDIIKSLFSVLETIKHLTRRELKFSFNSKIAHKRKIADFSQPTHDLIKTEGCFK